MLRPVTNLVHPEGFIRYSRGVALSRLGLVACFVALLAVFTPPRMAALGVLEFVFYLALLAAAEVAARDPDAAKASLRLHRQANALMFLLVANACWLAAQIRLYGDPLMQVEAALLAICVLLFAALRVHLGRVSYVVGVAPPAATLIWIAVDTHKPLIGDHYALAMMLFVAAVLVVTWRQQETDRRLNQALLDLARKNAALAQAVHEADAANRAKADLLAVASHEIRTPLNAVLGFARALRSQPLAPGQAELVRGVVEGGEQLTRLLDGVLNLALLEAGAARLSVEPVDLRELIGSVMRVWGEHARGLGVGFVFEDADPTLSYGVTADAGRIEQTLVTLVSNAMAATPAGGQVTTRLAAAPRGDMLSILIEVADTGPHVSPRDQALMFDAFEQTERGRLQGGTGLGMLLCAENLALMGGAIGIDEPEDRGDGAIFWFTFDAPVRMTPPPNDLPRMRRPIRVLAAEDNPANRMVLAALLEQEPVWLVFAEDGAQALEAWRSQAFDLILMDVNMPALNGREVVREIRRAEPPRRRTSIWMLTANVFDGDVADYLADGADGVLRKPIEVTALFDLLSRTADGLPRR